MAVPTNVINVQPQVLDLLLYAGDGVNIKFTCKDKNGVPVDITGTVKAQIRTTRTEPDPPEATFASLMTDAYQGIVLISLTGAQTEALMDDVADKFIGVWDVEWEPAGSEPVTIAQGKVECVQDVTR